MQEIAFMDLHLHTKYSLACSKYADLDGYSREAKLKGIDILGTADIFREEQLLEAQSKLQVCGNGIYVYNGVKFFITVEVSLIYREFDTTRKVHLLVVLSSFETVRKIKGIIGKYGKLESDGRPILKLSVREFTGIVRNEDPLSIIIPAHVWTPHFGIMGKKSGYEDIADAVDDMSVFSAMETGLSSDPDMNRMYGKFSDYSLVSFSDAHSPGKLGREATVLSTDSLDIVILRRALEEGNDILRGTVEFYPQEGKYFASGHRKCGYSTLDGDGLCPVCGRKLTEGVFARIRSKNGIKESVHDKEVYYNVPLIEIARYIKKRDNMKKAMKTIESEILQSIDEMYMKTIADPGEIDMLTGYRIGSLIERIRNGNLEFDAGYDGKFGKPLFKEDQ
ncbi:MAG: endonuclease Q family protein [bacterium]